jgi:hypothetical protein
MTVAAEHVAALARPSIGFRVVFKMVRELPFGFLLVVGFHGVVFNACVWDVKDGLLRHSALRKPPSTNDT